MPGCARSLILPQGTMVSPGSAPGTAQVIDITVGKVVATLSGHTDSITCIVVDMPYILTGSKDSSVKVWSSR